VPGGEESDPQEYNMMYVVIAATTTRSLLASVRDELSRPGRGKSVLDTLPFLNFSIHLFTLL
jgi:hypothetical protein